MHKTNLMYRNSDIFFMRLRDFWRFITTLMARQQAGAKKLERVVQQSEGWWFNPQLLLSACQSVLGKDTAQIAPDGCASSLRGSLPPSICVRLNG